MSIKTYEGSVGETGSIRLLDSVTLPVNTKVYVIVPESVDSPKQPKVRSPRLVNQSQWVDFELEITSGESDNASI